MEEKIILFKEYDYNHELNQSKQYLKSIQQFIDDVRMIAPINFTKDLVYDLVDNSNSYSVISAIKNAIEQQLKKAGITIPAILQSSTQDSYKQFLELKRGRVLNRNLIHQIEVADNIVSFQAGFEEELRKKYTHSVKTEAGMGLLQAQEDLVKALNRLADMINPHWEVRVLDFAYSESRGRNWHLVRGVGYDMLAKDNNYSINL